VLAEQVKAGVIVAPLSQTMFLVPAKPMLTQRVRANALVLEVFGDSAPTRAVLLEFAEPVLYLLGPHYPGPLHAGRGGLALLHVVVDADIGIDAQCNCVLERHVHRQALAAYLAAVLLASTIFLCKLIFCNFEGRLLETCCHVHANRVLGSRIHPVWSCTLADVCSSLQIEEVPKPWNESDESI
jgi:hypothetical protein